TAMAMAQALPEYPEKLDITLNGEKELPGVTVAQTMEPFDGDDYLTITVTGEYDGDFITLDFPTPEGWDGVLVFNNSVADDDIEPLKSKAPAKDDEECWMSLEYAGWLTPGNSLTFPVDGFEWGGSAYLVKGDNYYVIGIDFVFDVSQPAKYPDHLDFTINGAKELAGVTVTQELDEGVLNILASGKTTAEQVTFTFDTPAGWDGFMISAPYGEVSEKEFIKTRSEEDWTPIEYLEPMGYVPGNSVTFVIDGEDNFAGLALIKDGKAYVSPIAFNFSVTKEEGSGDEPGDGLVFPDHFIVDTFDEGLEVTQGVEWGVFTIKVEGEVASDYVSIVIDTPEGWDGLISKNWSSEGEVIIEENNPGPRGTRAEEVELEPIADLGDDFVKGNRFTFETSYVPGNENYHTVEIRLYKGDMATVEEVNLEIYVSKGSGDVTADNQKAYDEAIAQLDALKEKYEAAAVKIKEVNPDFDFSMYEEIPVMIEQLKQYAAQALSAANEEGAPFSEYYYGGAEEIDGYITMMLMEGDPAPEFPASFDVALSSDKGVELTTDDTQGVFIINVTGKSSEKEITVSIALPEGFDSVMHFSTLDMMDPGIEVGPLSTRADEPDWYPVSWALEEGMKEGNSMTFPVDGELYAGNFFLCKHGYVDLNNQVNVEFEVEYDETSGVSGVNAAENATYYDLHGNQIAKPSKGICVKVVDGKATKVVVK
ncbi:MAG: hypothetical protein K2H38_08165, partial [Muribaculaceae bacterium]|nr:hypothetical protein [Muribaculaceae bacterium]